MANQVLKKTPAEERLFGFDFSTKMAATSTLVSIEAITIVNQNQVPGSIPVTYQDDVAGLQKVVALFKEGTDGERYLVTCRVKDSLGQTLELDGWLNVSEETILVVEAGNGNPLANAYISAYEADLLAEQGPFAKEWDTKTEDEKENLIYNATKFLDLRYRWYGQVYSDQQRLQWPRTKNYDDLGRLIPAGTIPRQLKEATAALAAAFAKDPSALEGVVAGMGAVKSWSTDGISLTFDTQSAEGDDPGMAGSGQLLGPRYVNVEFNLRSIGTLKDVDWLQGTKQSEVRTWA